MDKTKLGLPVALTLALTACGGSDSGGSSDSNTGPNQSRSDVGIYEYQGVLSAEQPELTLMVSKAGNTILTNHYGIGDWGILLEAWSPITKIGTAGDTISHSFALKDSGELSIGNASLKTTMLGSSNGDQVPFTYSLPSKNIEISDVFTFHKSEGNGPLGLDTLNQGFFSAGGTQGDYKYNSNGTFTYTGDDGCEVTGKASLSGLYMVDGGMFDVEVVSSSCPTDSNSTGFIFVSNMPVVGTMLTIQHTLKDGEGGWAGSERELPTFP